jgi:nitric oxide dioxygenase
MTFEEIAAIERTWERVAATPDDAAQRFYANLFAAHPQLRPLFRGDMREQGKKLMQTLALAVGSLQRPDAIREPVARLGARHVAYGVRREHYPLVGATLIGTLREALGAELTPEAQKAWQAAIALLAGWMIQGAEAENA